MVQTDGGRVVQALVRSVPAARQAVGKGNNEQNADSNTACDDVRQIRLDLLLPRLVAAARAAAVSVRH